MPISDSNKKPLIAVLDYGIGNLRSAQKGLQFVGADARLTNDIKLIAEADAVVLPGVGNFGACMTALREAGQKFLPIPKRPCRRTSNLLVTVQGFCLSL